MTLRRRIVLCLCRFTADAFACTTQPEKTARGVRTFTMTPPGGLETATQLISAGVNIYYIYNKKKNDVLVSLINEQWKEGSLLK